ncbi:MAG TPA: PEP-CTERM sorting domain-containing protein [Phycisphaerales bacterium]|nr:PEP-CTERM sorting domain-containing protein [Phycisphaerales bacterium]
MKLACALSMSLAVVGAARASIVSTSGMCTQIGAPASALPGSLAAMNAWAWNEQTGVSLVSMPVDLSTNPSNSNAPVPGALSGLVDSHFIHLDGMQGMVVGGTVTFSAPIVAVQYRDTNLDLSDGLATTGTIYPTTLPQRGFNNWTGADFVDINGNVLTFQFSTVSPASNLEQVRVFTKVPAPGSTALLAVGGLAAVRRRRVAR